MKILKWIVYSFLVIILIVVAFSVKAVWSTEQRLNKKYAFALPDLSVKSDSAIIAEGHRLMITKGCRDCHGDDLGGKIWIDNPLLGKIIAPNLTKGSGGLAKDYNSNDWLRSLKHGLRRDSTALRLMPSNEFTFLAEDDMQALIAYCSQLKPIDRTLPETKIGLVGYLLAELEQIPMVPAENVDHARPLTKTINREVSVELGQYLSIGCEGCHRKNMKGGAPVAPGFPKVADITKTGNLGKWTEAEFIKTLKTGVTPEGKKLKPEEMPWVSFQDYTEKEYKALFLYLKNI
jgi:cytochrome c553